MGDNGDGRKIRVGSCPIRECPACFPDGCRCGYRIDNVPCYHPVYRRRWHEAMAMIEEAEDEAEPVQTLTARVSAAARAKLEQLGLELEV